MVHDLVLALLLFVDHDYALGFQLVEAIVVVEHHDEHKYNGQVANGLEPALLLFEDLRLGVGVGVSKEEGSAHMPLQGAPAMPR